MAGLRHDVWSTYRGAARVYRHHPAALLGPGLVLFAVAGWPAALLDGVDATSAVEALAIVGAQLTSYVASFTFYAYCEEVADQARRGHVSTRLALRRTLPMLHVLIAGSLLAALGTLIGFVLLVIPGLWAVVRWSVASPVLSFERPGPMGALRRSSRLTRGHLVYVLLTAVLVIFAQSAASSAAEFIGSHLGIGEILAREVKGVIVDVLLAPFFGLVVVGAYHRLAEAPPRPERRRRGLLSRRRRART